MRNTRALASLAALTLAGAGMFAVSEEPEGKDEPRPEPEPTIDDGLPPLPVTRQQRRAAARAARKGGGR
jgi:hypothetical protein